MYRDELSNMPFKPSEQKKTLAANSGMFARLLCSVVRSIEQRHPWTEEYPTCIILTIYGPGWRLQTVGAPYQKNQSGSQFQVRPQNHTVWRGVPPFGGVFLW